MPQTFPPAPSMLLFTINFFLGYLAVLSSGQGGDRRAYIVHMDTSVMPTPFATHESWYLSMLSTLTTATAKDAPSHLYTYTHVMHGFSAVLTAAQLQELQQADGHLAAWPDSYARVHTTHTPEFLGLSRGTGIWPTSSYGGDAIIGIVDTGVWPESESFTDVGMPPVPTRWKGKCETGQAFNASLCNRKLIGARSFSKGLKHQGLNISDDDYDSPRDYSGHGSHTASTAAGHPVKGESYFGYAKGTVSGIAPMARIAMYKAVFSSDTLRSAATDVLAAMDQAIADGVDLMSLSLSFPETEYYTNVIAVGAFAAMEKGIFVACSAGNDGADGYTITNGAPWITTIGAGSTDRDFAATITLANGEKSIQGRSVYPQSMVITGADLYFGHGNKSKQSCRYLSLSRKEVAGKFVFCSASESIREQIGEAHRNGAGGVIISSDMTEFLEPSEFFMPLVEVSLSDGETIKKYIAATRAPKVSIRFIVTELGLKPAPRVANFSARGPSLISPGILKPDIIAPGVDILAAWVPNKEILVIGDDKLFTKYMLQSGTSMSSPHVAGVAAMLRSVHKDWSPAAIRSAMMTTAYVTDNANNMITSMPTGVAGTPLDFGGGHVNPNQAMDAGLVYDAGIEDYINFLCGLHYTNHQIAVITRRRNFSCVKASLDLNYPSFMIILNKTKSASRTFKRVLTNIDDSTSRYRVSVTAPAGMEVTVTPPVLSFSGKGSKQQFSVTVQINLSKQGGGNGNYIGNYGFLSWNEVGGKHVVRSPIVSAFAA